MCLSKPKYESELFVTIFNSTLKNWLQKNFYFFNAETKSNLKYKKKENLSFPSGQDNELDN